MTTPTRLPARVPDNGGWLPLLAAVLRDTPRLPGALCRGRHRLFDADGQHDVSGALELCGRCPARGPCAEWASREPAYRLTGVLAGQRYVAKG